jgi:Tfp pilus assembly protein PilO
MKSTIKKKRRISRREASMIAAILITATAVFLWQTAGQDLLQEIVQLSEKSTTLDTEIAALEDILNRKINIESKWAQIEEDEERLNMVLPEITELPTILGELENIIEIYDSYITSLQAGEVEYFDNHISLPFTLSATGPPYVITSIIQALEAFPRLLAIDYLRWSSINNESAAVEINYRVYLYNNSESRY